jgi:ketosteroid isomerase-like protein
MSQENVEIVEEGWRAINRGDTDALLNVMTDDVDLRPPSHMLDGIVFRGHAGVREWMERQAESWSELEGTPHEVARLGDQLVMAIDVRLVGHESGVPVNQRSFVVYTFREGKVAAIIAYPGEREALKALGLSE